MVCSTTSQPPTDAADCGFATPAAAVVSLSLALMASALMSASVQDLRLARTDLDRQRVETAMAGAHQAAVMATLGDGGGARLRWVSRSNIGDLRILAEPEAAKMSLAAAAELDDATMSKLGVTDAGALKARLKAFAADPPTPEALEATDPSPVWRDCVRSLISVEGGAKMPPLLKARGPTPGEPSWRTGEIWRLRVTDAQGWTDDRLVRFTGDAGHPAAVLERRYLKRGQEGDQCDAIFGAS